MGFEAEFIELADKVNSSMPPFVVELVVNALNERGQALKGARILLVGVTYKADVNDLRERPRPGTSGFIWPATERSSSYSDPYVPEIDIHPIRALSQPISAASLREYDCVGRAGEPQGGWTEEHSRERALHRGHPERFCGFCAKRPPVQTGMRHCDGGRTRGGGGGGGRFPRSRKIPPGVVDIP